jgi:hypothetical protein
MNAIINKAETNYFPPSQLMKCTLLKLINTFFRSNQTPIIVFCLHLGKPIKMFHLMGSFLFSKNKSIFVESSSFCSHEFVCYL